MKNKSTQIIIRMTAEEKVKLEKLAAEAGVTMSEYVRAIIFDSNHLSRMVASEVQKQLKIRQEVINSVHHGPKTD